MGTTQNRAAATVNRRPHPVTGSLCWAIRQRARQVQRLALIINFIPRASREIISQISFSFSALVNQFMTSEYMHTYDASLDDEFGEKTVSILLDGEESEMIFIDHPASEMSVSINKHCGGQKSRPMK